MDHEFRANEMDADPEHENYEKWIAAVGKQLQRDIEMGSQLESDLFALYEHDFKPWEAAIEITAQESIAKDGCA